MSQDFKRRLLKKVWLFATLDDGELDVILSRAREVVCQAHHVLVRQGEDTGDLFAVIEGRLKVATNVEDEEMLLSIMGPGEVFGEIALLDGEPRSATVSALERCRLLVLPRASFRALLQSIPTLGLRLLESMARRVRALTYRAEDSLIRDVPTRLAKAVAGLAERFGVPAGAGKIRISLKLSQQELGNLIGATREIVNKSLGRLARGRVLRHRDGILVVLDPARLRALADGGAVAGGGARRGQPRDRARA
jgi:CRP-like cAMP-binding protein